MTDVALAARCRSAVQRMDKAERYLATSYAGFLSILPISGRYTDAKQRHFILFPVYQSVVSLFILFWESLWE